MGSFQANSMRGSSVDAIQRRHPYLSSGEAEADSSGTLRAAERYRHAHWAEGACAPASTQRCNDATIASADVSVASESASFAERVAAAAQLQGLRPPAAPATGTETPCHRPADPEFTQVPAGCFTSGWNDSMLDVLADKLSIRLHAFVRNVVQSAVTSGMDPLSQAFSQYPPAGSTFEQAENKQDGHSASMSATGPLDRHLRVPRLEIPGINKRSRSCPGACVSDAAELPSACANRSSGFFRRHLCVPRGEARGAGHARCWRDSNWPGRPTSEPAKSDTPAEANAAVDPYEAAPVLPDGDYVAARGSRDTDQSGSKPTSNQMQLLLNSSESAESACSPNSHMMCSRSESAVPTGNTADGRSSLQTAASDPVNIQSNRPRKAGSAPRRLHASPTRWRKIPWATECGARNAQSIVPSAETAPHRRQILFGRPDDEHSVQTLMLGCADHILQEQGLLPSTPTGHDGTFQQESTTRAGQSSHFPPSVRVGISMIDDEEPQAKTVQESVEVTLTGGAPEDGSPTSDNVSWDPSSVRSDLTTMSSCSVRRLWQARANQLVATMGASADYPSYWHSYKDQSLSKIMRMSGVLPWSCVDDDLGSWFNLAVLYQRLVFLLVVGSCGICWWNLLAEKLVHQDVDVPSTEHAGLLMDVPMTTGAALGLLAVQAHTGSHKLHMFKNVLRSFSCREGFYERWMKQARRDVGFSILVLSLVIALRLYGEGLTWHAGACVLCSLVIIVLTYTMVYFCRALSAMVDQYCIHVVNTPISPQIVTDWQCVFSVLRHASYVLEKCVFVLHAIAFLSLVLGLMEILPREPNAHQYASFGAWALVALDAVRMIFCAALVTDKCTRVPNLIISYSNEISIEKSFIVEYILHSGAGFYVFEIRLDSSLAFKFAYLACVSAFAVATEFTFQL